jgi:NADPH:quinone reductase-like Zn-dependent oxidoreductase
MSLTDTADRKHYAEILTEIARLVDEGTIKPLVGACVNFSEIAKAHAMQEAHEVIGKIVLKQDL